MPKGRADQTSPPRGEGGVGIRTCVACRQEAGKRTLIRIVRGPEGGVQVDLSGRAPGRGAYLHRDPGCIENARRKRALERSLHAIVGAEVWPQLIP
jgi:predicted RNA-binding protein YlxR (DUF448 family)